MEFLILGPLQVRNERGPVALGGIKPRAVMAVLVLHANESVSAERLALALWGEEAPANAVKTVQVHVSRLRKALGDPERIATTPVGYRLRVEPGELDAERFELLVEDGGRALAAGQPEHAALVLGEAMSMWRGPALEDVAYEPFAQAEIARLEEQRLAALEARVEADLAAGRHRELLAELQRLLATYPTRERLAGQLMRALYCCGRQAEAFEVFSATRRVLVDDIGVEPGPELRRLHEAILRQDASLEPQQTVAELPWEIDVAAAPPLVGRDSQIAWLKEHWNRARSGAGALVLVTGIRGIGKSRLAAELAQDVHRIGARVLYAVGTDPTERIVLTLDRAAKAMRPTLLVIDDVDRVDAEVLAHLSELARGLADVPVLVVATAEKNEAMAQLGTSSVIALEPLGEEGLRGIAARYAPDRSGDGIPVEWLLEASGAVPGRIHEVAGEWARQEAARRVGAGAGRTAARRADLRSMEAQLADDVVELQAARERVALARNVDASIVCPFKGLASFDISDAPYFFGREKLIAELVAGLVGAQLLGIVGPSGSGKSSVMRAGLVPALAGGVLPGSELWKQVLIRPGEHPLRELTGAMEDIRDRERAVIAVDQFEETFTTCEDEAERAAFIAALVRATREGNNRCVVIALRADYYGRCAAYPELARLLASNHVLVGLMQRDELTRTIELPAERVGLRVDRELTDALVADVKDEPGALPWLSTALLELWQHRDGRRLRYTVYEQTGGVRGAVARLAEEAFGQLDADQQVLARGVLMRLAGEGVGGGVERRRVALAELELDKSADAARVVALLTDRRLLTASSGTIELAHEALLREWPRLRGWIDADRDGLRIQRNLNAAAREWEDLGRDEGALYRGIRLGEASEWCASHAPSLNALERDFLEASEARRARERTQRRRRVMLAFSSLSAVLIAISIVAIASVSRSREAERQRDIAASRAIAARSGEFVTSDPRLSLALAFEALARSKTDAAKNALRQATLANRAQAVWSVSGAGPAYGIAISRDRALLATAADDGTVRVRRVDDGSIVSTITPDKAAAAGERPVVAVSFSPSRRRIAFANVGGEIVVADVQSGRGSTALQLKGTFALSVDFSPDGKSVLIGTDDGKVGLLPLRQRGELRLMPASGTVPTRAQYSNDGTRVLAVSTDGLARIWRITGGAPSRLRAGTKQYAADFSRDDKHVTAVGIDGYVRIWEIDRPGTAPRRIRVDRQTLLSVRFSADGQRVIAGGDSGVLRVMDVRDRRPLAELRGHFGEIGDAAFLGGEDDVVSVGYDGTLRRWSLLPVTRLSGRIPTGRPSLSSDGTRVASAFADGVVRIWNPESGSTRTLPSTEKTIKVAYSADGRRVVGASKDRVRLWDVASGESWLVPAPAGEKYGIAINSTGSRVAIATLDAPAIVQRPDGMQRTELKGQQGEINAVAFSPDDRYVVGGGEEHAAIWDARSGRQVRSLHHNESVVDASYSQNGRYIATATTDGTLRIWPVTGGPPVLLYGHVGHVNTVQFDPSGKRLVSAGRDGTVRIWNTAGGEALATLLTYRHDALGARFSSGGKRVVSSEANGAIEATSCEVCGSFAEVLALARSRSTRSLTASERQRLLTDDD
jgi:WD40 repeat protein/DNA-binding SARP family transcriptional activator